jgi:cation:H+ antiporter
MKFVPLALVLAGAGWVLERSTTRIVQLTCLEASVAGLLVTTVCTSLPELITSVAAVRRGALTLAVGGIVGGNTFDTRFSAAADFAYRDGSLYHQVSESVTGWFFLCVLMISVLLLGLLRREKHGIAGIGVEGVTVIGCYLVGVITVLGG